MSDSRRSASRGVSFHLHEDHQPPPQMKNPVMKDSAMLKMHHSPPRHHSTSKILPLNNLSSLSPAARVSSIIPKDLEILDMQKTASITAQAQEKEEPEEQDVCPICLEVPNIRGIMSSCDHTCCFDCILKWSSQTNKCPVCKRRFSYLLEKATPLDEKSPDLVHTRKRKSRHSSGSGSRVRIRRKDIGIRYRAQHASRHHRSRTSRSEIESRRRMMYQEHDIEQRRRTQEQDNLNFLNRVSARETGGHGHHDFHQEEEWQGQDVWRARDGAVTTTPSLLPRDVSAPLFFRPMDSPLSPPALSSLDRHHHHHHYEDDAYAYRVDEYSEEWSDDVPQEALSSRLANESLVFSDHHHTQGRPSSVHPSRRDRQRRVNMSMENILDFARTQHRYLNHFRSSESGLDEGRLSFLSRWHDHDHHMA